MRNGASVLVVDDQTEIRELLALILERSGYEVVQAARCGAAVEILATREVQAVLLDLDLPDAPGEALLAWTQRQARRPAVIVVTAHDPLPEGVAAKAQGVLSKPFGIDELLGTLESVLTGRRSPGEFEPAQAAV